MRRALEGAHLAAGIVPYLRDPTGPGQAREAVAARVRDRDRAFVEFARRSILGDARSPHRRLLEWAGWDHDRLAQAVARDGLEPTLEALRAAGVHTTLEEFKCRRPIRRRGLELTPRPEDFDNPRLRRHTLRAATSGTTSPVRSTVAYGWELFAEEAELECLLFEAHGCLDAPCALWLPGPPSISGLHNLLVHLRFRRPPERWFSHLPARRRDAAAVAFVRAAARPFGMRVPAPEPTPPGEAERVVRWLAATRNGVLKTFATSAVRVAEAARRAGVDLAGTTIFAGGEPLTDRRRRFIESSGARVFGRYVTTETGWVAGACPHAPSPAHLHLYTDRLAVVAGDGGRLLFTTTAASAGKQLLNTDLGDAGALGERRCACPFGAAGLDAELSAVHGQDKLTGDGMTVARAVLADVVDEVLTGAGGAPDAFQLVEEEDERGGSRLAIVLSPAVDGVGEDELVERVLERLPAHGPAEALAARFWGADGTIEVRREQPVPSDGMKLPRFARR
jgi:hypothetical protein